MVKQNSEQIDFTTHNTITVCEGLLKSLQIAVKSGAICSLDLLEGVFCAINELIIIGHNCLGLFP